MALFGKKKDTTGYRDVTKPRQRTQKQILIELIMCFIVLALYAGRDVFFPNWDIFNERKNEPTPTPIVSAEPITTVSGAGALSQEALSGMNVTLPASNDGWRVFVYEAGEQPGYALVSDAITDIDKATLTAGYRISSGGVSVYTEDVAVLAELFRKMPTGDRVTVFGGDGQTVDSRLFALIADGANKGGLSIELFKATPTPSAN